jgi:hypothetical protein
MCKKNTPKTLAAAALLLMSSTGMAASSSVTAYVTRTLVSGGPTTSNYGGCMASLSVSPTTKLPSCSANWVTFSCTGNFATNTVQAYHLLDQAQLALAGNKKVTVFFQDDKKHNGYCFASQINVLK